MSPPARTLMPPGSDGYAKPLDFSRDQAFNGIRARRGLGLARALAGKAGGSTLERRTGEIAASAADRKRRDRDADVLADLAEKHIKIDRDVIEIDEEKWAIHGHIAYEGEVIAATFASEHEAWVGLSRLDEIERDHPA